MPEGGQRTIAAALNRDGLARGRHHRPGLAITPVDDLALSPRCALAESDGARTVASRKSTPWAEGEVIDRGDGETWTVVATTGKSITVQRDRDGALATLGQLGEDRP